MGQNRQIRLVNTSNNNNNNNNSNKLEIQFNNDRWLLIPNEIKRQTNNGFVFKSKNLSTNRIQTIGIRLITNSCAKSFLQFYCKIHGLTMDETLPDLPEFDNDNNLLFNDTLNGDSSSSGTESPTPQNGNANNNNNNNDDSNDDDDDFDNPFGEMKVTDFLSSKLGSGG